MHHWNSIKTHTSYHPWILKLDSVLQYMAIWTMTIIKNVVTHSITRKFSLFITNMGYLDFTQPI